MRGSTRVHKTRIRIQAEVYRYIYYICMCIEKPRLSVREWGATRNLKPANTFCAESVVRETCLNCRRKNDTAEKVVNVFS